MLRGHLPMKRPEGEPVRKQRLCFRLLCLFVFVGGLAGASSSPDAAAPEVLLADRTELWGLDFVHLNGMSGSLYFVEMMGAGVASFDYDRDGDQDLFLVQGQMLGGATASSYPLPLPPDTSGRDRLFRNDSYLDDDGNRKRRFVDVTQRSGIESLGYGMGVATGDYDNDGWVDLYVTNFGANRLLRNQGDGTFRDETLAAKVIDDGWSVAASFFDFDADGWLDLFVGNYVDYRLATQRACQSETGAFDYCSPLAYPPAPDRLFRNQGDGTFRDVTNSSGLSKAFGGALGAVVADWNSDGRLDLYVANDGTANQLWLNQPSGGFIDEAVLAGSAVNAEGQPEASMGVVAGDLNDDGSEDLFMVHLTRETHTLYLNDGSGLFREATRESGLGMASWQYTGFGTVLADLNLDGYLDLFVANGAVKRIEDQLRAEDPLPLRQENQLFVGLGGATFVAQPLPEALRKERVSRGAVASDLDSDGRMDLVVANNAGPARILGNESPLGSWLGVRVESTGGRPLLGASATLAVEDESWLRRVRTDGSYASASDPRIVWGLESSSVVAHLEVTALDGRRTRWLRPPVGRYLLVRPAAALGTP